MLSESKDGDELAGPEMVASVPLGRNVKSISKQGKLWSKDHYPSELQLENLVVSFRFEGKKLRKNGSDLKKTSQ